MVLQIAGASVHQYPDVGDAAERFTAQKEHLSFSFRCCFNRLPEMIGRLLFICLDSSGDFQLFMLGEGI